MVLNEIYTQCAQLIARFYHCLDTSDYNGLASLVSPDTVWYRQGTPLKGPEAVLEALQARDSARQTSHQCVNLFVVPDAQEMTATAHYYVNVYDNQGPGGSLQLKTIMKSQDCFELHQGQWRLLTKRATRLLA